MVDVHTGDVPSLVAAVLVLVAVAAGVQRWVGAGVAADSFVAVGRAAVQLVVVALVIGWIFTHPGALVPYLGVMLVVATATAARRIGLVGHGIGIRDPGVARHAFEVLGAIGAGAATTVGVVLASGALSSVPNAALPYAAQVIGGSMVAAALAGGRLRDDAIVRWDEVEAWLSIGATPRQAIRDLGRRAVARSLVPALDQTRTAGLVSLPGAFVGLLLGGATPLQAAQVQLLVLVGMLAAESVSAALTVTLVGPTFARYRPRADR